MGCLQTLEVYCYDVKDLLYYTGKLKQLTIYLYVYSPNQLEISFKHWIELKMRPPSINAIIHDDSLYISTVKLLDYAAQITAIPSDTNARFRVYGKCNKICLNFSPTFPLLQLQFTPTGQVTTPRVKLSDFGMLGLNNDVAVMADCQYGERIMHMVRYQANDNIVSRLNLINIAEYGNLSFVTYFDLTDCFSLRYVHLEQIAVTCPNIQRLNLMNCGYCLENLQGLRAIASSCRKLQVLNLLGIHDSLVVDHVILWEILSDMKLTYLAVEFSVLRSQPANKEKLICLFKKCLSIRGIHCSFLCGNITIEDAMFLSCFPSLNYFYSSDDVRLPTVIQDVVNNCKGLRGAYFNNFYPLTLSIAHAHSLQQLYIFAPNTDVPDDFMTSISAHGGLAHVVIRVRSLTVEGITSLVKNSLKLITLQLSIIGLTFEDENFIATFWKVPAVGHSMFFPVSFWDNICSYWQ